MNKPDFKPVILQVHEKIREEPVTLPQLKEELGLTQEGVEEAVYILEDLGKIQVVEASWNEPIYHQEWGEIPEVLENMMSERWKQ